MDLRLRYKNMTGTYTTSETFTLTHAKYLASKVAADLLQMQLFYNRPSTEQINQYIDELTTLLIHGYLDSVDYGFKKDNKWLVQISYSVKNGNISTDDRSGSIYTTADVSGAAWSSYLRKSSKYNIQPQTEKQRVEALLPFTREGQPESGFQPGRWISDKNYYNGGISLERKVFQPY